MSHKASKPRATLVPDHVNDKPCTFLKHKSGAGVAGNRERLARIFNFGLPRSSTFSPATLRKNLGAKVESIVRFVSIRRKRSAGKLSSASFARSRSSADAIDSQRAEAIEDCIEFLNSSSSL